MLLFVFLYVFRIFWRLYFLRIVVSLVFFEKLREADRILRF